MNSPEKPIFILDTPTGVVYIFARLPLAKLHHAIRTTSPANCDRPGEPCIAIVLDSSDAVEESMVLSRAALAEHHQAN